VVWARSARRRLERGAAGLDGANGTTTGNGNGNGVRPRLAGEGVAPARIAATPQQPQALLQGGRRPITDKSFVDIHTATAVGFQEPDGRAAER